MLRANRTLWAGLLLLAGALVAGPVAATPLNLQSGDLIDTIEWDALNSNGDGGFFNSVTQEIVTNGRITSVDVERAPLFPPTLTSIPQTGVSFIFAADLIYAGLSGTMLNVQFTNSASTNPDVTIIQNGNVILTGDFSGNFVFGGDITSPSLLSAGNIDVTGGDPALVAAIGAVAKLELTASVFGFSPNLAVIAAAISGNSIGTSFNVEFSGTLRPASAAPFVPEPSTAALAGLGILGLLAAGRRLRANRNV